jgi:hypothetical protein
MTNWYCAKIVSLLKNQIMKLPFTLGIVLLLVGQIALAQNNKTVLNKTSGTVTDEINLPIANATITIFANYKLYQTQTDSNGNYCVAGIPNGEYNIIVKSINYEEQNLFLLLKNGSSKSFVQDFSLFSATWSSCITKVKIKEKINPILRAPNQNINAIAAYMRGVDSRSGETPSIMGARPENTAYYLDGVRLAGMEENLTIIGK